MQDLSGNCVHPGGRRILTILCSLAALKGIVNSVSPSSPLKFCVLMPDLNRLNPLSPPVAQMQSPFSMPQTMQGEAIAMLTALHVFVPQRC